jgi:hypothetical protein
MVRVIVCESVGSLRTAVWADKNVFVCVSGWGGGVLIPLRF